MAAIQAVRPGRGGILPVRRMACTTVARSTSAGATVGGIPVRGALVNRPSFNEATGILVNEAGNFAAASTGNLTVDTVDAQTAVLPPTGMIRVDDEVASYSSISAATTLVIAARGQWGTTAEIWENDDIVYYQPAIACLYTSQAITTNNHAKNDEIVGICVEGTPAELTKLFYRGTPDITDLTAPAVFGGRSSGNERQAAAWYRNILLFDENTQFLINRRLAAETAPPQIGGTYGLYYEADGTCTLDTDNTVPVVQIMEFFQPDVDAGLSTAAVADTSARARVWVKPVNLTCLI